MGADGTVCTRRSRLREQRPGRGSEAGLIACITALVAVLTLVPLLGVLLVRREAVFVAKVKGADFAVDLLTRFCAWIAARMVRHAGLYSLLAVLVVAGLGVIYANGFGVAIDLPVAFALPSKTCSSRGPSTGPGRIVFTRIPASPSSIDSVLVRPIRPHFVVA